MALSIFNDERKKTLFIVLSLSIGIILFDILLVVRPLWSQYSSYKKKYAAMTKDLRASMKKVKDEDLILYIAKLKKKISQLDKKLVNEYDLPFIMEKISAMAKDCGIITRRINPEDYPKDGDLYFSVFSYAGKGTYHNLGKFLSKLEGEDYISKISKLKIIPNPNDYTQNDIKITIAILTKKT